MSIKISDFEKNILNKYGPEWRKKGLFYRRLYGSEDPESYSAILLMTNELPIDGIVLGVDFAKRIAKKYGIVLTTYDFSKERSKTDERYVFQIECKTIKKIEKATKQLIEAKEELIKTLPKLKRWEESWVEKLIEPIAEDS